jgi:hypothetical protein
MVRTDLNQVDTYRKQGQSKDQNGTQGANTWLGVFKRIPTWFRCCKPGSKVVAADADNQDNSSITEKSDNITAVQNQKSRPLLRPITNQPENGDDELPRNENEHSWLPTCIQGLRKARDPKDEEMLEQRDQPTSLHQNKLWRSALEVIVDHEVQEFVKDELFQRLIKDKWDRFGCWMYIKRTVAPYLLVLACLLSVAYLRGNEINAAWPYLSPNSDSPVTLLCLQSANMSSPAALLAWIAAELPADGLSASFSFATLVMNLLLVVAGAPFLLWKGLRQRRLRIQDLDTNADANISFDEIMLFIQKNLHFVLDILGAGLIIGAAAARIMCKDSYELNLLATASIVLCFNFINVMLPFRFFGPLVIMIYKILREDVCHLLSIYCFIVIGFGFGLFLLFQVSDSRLGCDLPGAGGCSSDGEPSVYIGVFTSILWLVWVSLGDNVGNIQVTSPTLNLFTVTFD